MKGAYHCKQYNVGALNISCAVSVDVNVLNLGAAELMVQAAVTHPPHGPHFYTRLHVMWVVLEFLNSNSLRRPQAVAKPCKIPAFPSQSAPRTCQ